MVVSHTSYYNIRTFPTLWVFSTPVEFFVENVAKYLFKLYYYLFVSA